MTAQLLGFEILIHALVERDEEVLTILRKPKRFSSVHSWENFEQGTYTRPVKRLLAIYLFDCVRIKRGFKE